MVPLTRFSLLLLVATLLTACGTAEPLQRDRFFSLEPPARVPAPATPVKTALLVNDLAARGFLGGRQIVYRTAERPLEVQRYNELLWEEPPGRAVADGLVQALRAARLFEFVVTPAQRARADYILGGELNRFEHLPTAQSPRVSVDFTLTLMREDDRRSMLSGRYQGEEPTQDTTPEAMAQAFNRLTGRLVDRAVADLRGLRPRLGRRSERQ